MNKIQKISAALTVLVLVITVLFSSCKKNFDQPPYQTDPSLTANTSIKDLKARHTSAGAYDLITTDIIISGIVVADDKSGNLYKEIYIEDSTGAIQVNLDATNLYGTYPVGRRVFVKCNGLCLSDYHNTMELGIKATINGAASLEAIPAVTISNYVIGGSLNNPVVPKVVTASQLGTSLQDPYIGTLIQLDGYEFQASDTSKTYADTSTYKNSTDLYIKSCTSTTTLDVRSSGYANFAALKPAKGYGSIISLYTVYNTTKQLLIRDTSDVRFTGARCDAGSGGGGGGTGGGTALTMMQLRALPQGTTISSGTVVAKVISNNLNEASGNYRIEDESGAGVILYAASGSPTYSLGTVLNINLSGGKLSLYNGDLELSGVPLNNVSTSTASVNPVAIVRTIAQITASASTISSTLVKINNVTSITMGTSNSTGVNYTVTDATGSLALFVRTAAGITVNTSGTSITGYVSLFNTTAQIGIRSASDIQ